MSTSLPLTGESSSLKGNAAQKIGTLEYKLAPHVRQKSIPWLHFWYGEKETNQETSRWQGIISGHR